VFAILYQGLFTSTFVCLLLCPKHSAVSHREGDEIDASNQCNLRSSPSQNEWLFPQPSQKSMYRILNAIEGYHPATCICLVLAWVLYILLYRLQKLTSHLTELKMFVGAVVCIIC